MSTISTRDLTALPDVPKLKSLLQAMAMLDAIIEPEWQFRYYSFNSKWSDEMMMGSMRNGSGDDFFALFTDAGCYVKGWMHEAPVAWNEQLRESIYVPVPDEFSSGVHEPAFAPMYVTFCLWRKYSDIAWRASTDNLASYDDDDPDGSKELLSILDGNPQSYWEWAESYYDERKFDLTAIAKIYEMQPLTAELVRRLNPENSLELLAEDIEEIGYPCGK